MEKERAVLERYVAARLEREARLRLFPQLHQDPNPEEAQAYDRWYRAEGGARCGHCGLEYRHHPFSEDAGTREDGQPIDHRLCNGDVVHL